MRMYAAVLGTLLLVTTPLEAQHTTDYTLFSVVSKMRSWGMAAAGYSKYRWEKESKELLDSVIGSTIRIDGLLIDTDAITVTNDRAEYRQTLHTSDSGNPVSGAAPGLQHEKIRSTKGYEHTWSAGRQAPGVFLRIRDNSDRMALELAGKQRVNIIGRISDAGLGVCPEQRVNGMGRLDFFTASPYLFIDVTTWEPSDLGSPNAMPGPTVAGPKK